MIHVETEYFGLNRILLLIIGLWPYQQSNLTLFQFIILSSILTMNVVFQCTVFISQKCTPDLTTKVLSSVFLFTVFVIKYNIFYLKIKIMKDILEQLLHTCNKLKDASEIAIIDEYRYNAKRYTVVFTIFVVFGILVFIVASFWLDIFNIILPANASRTDHMLIITEYFINQEKYFYLITLHILVSICIGVMVIVAIGAMFITYLQHTCGLFKIASYRIECAMNINMLQNINLRKNILILRGLICAVDIHRKAMKLSKLLISHYQTMYFCLVLLGVGSMSLNLYRITSFTKNIEEFIISFIYATVTIVYMFISNYIGQSVTNHNHHVYITAYNVPWYVAPLYIQRMTLFLLQNRSKDFTLSAGFFIASIENFAALMKASVSYFTVIYSTQ